MKLVSYTTSKSWHSTSKGLRLLPPTSFPNHDDSVILTFKATTFTQLYYYQGKSTQRSAHVFLSSNTFATNHHEYTLQNQNYVYNQVFYIL